MKTRFLLVALIAAIICGLSAPLPADEPAMAYQYFAQAIDALVEPQHLGENIEPGTEPKLVADNRAALTLVRLGLKYDYHYVSPQQEWMSDMPADSPEYLLIAHLHRASSLRHSGYFQLAYLLKAAGDVRAKQGDWRGAADNYVDAVKLGIEVTRGGLLMDALVGQGIQDIGRQPLEDSLPRLDSTTAQRTTRRLETVLASATSWPDTVRGELDYAQAMVSSPPLTPSLTPQYRRAFKRRYHELTEDLITQAGRPYVATKNAGGKKADADREKQTTPAPNTAPVEAEKPRDPDNDAQTIFNMNSSRIPILRPMNAANRVQNQLLLAAVALHSYRAAHGEYPETLLELVPGYIEKVPTDAFGQDKPLRYQKEGKKYLLYSLGPDGLDDGGKPIVTSPAEDRRKALVRLTEADAKGDIVFGVNN